MATDADIAKQLGLDGTFEQYPVMAALLQLVPFGIGSAVDTLINAAFAKERERRLVSFLRKLLEVQEGTLANALTVEYLESDAGRDIVMKAIAAATRTRHEDKHLILASITARAAVSDTDAQEDAEIYIDLIDSLAMRHWHLLEDLRRVVTTSHAFKESVRAHLGNTVRPNSNTLIQLAYPQKYQKLMGDFARLAGMGLLKLRTGATSDVGDDGHSYGFTDLYVGLREYINPTEPTQED